MNFGFLWSIPINIVNSLEQRKLQHKLDFTVLVENDILTGNLYFVWGVFFKCQYSVKKCDVWVLELVEWGDNIGVKTKGDFKEWVVADPW